MSQGPRGPPAERIGTSTSQDLCQVGPALGTTTEFDAQLTPDGVQLACTW
jgi:hypothetical protein